MIKEQKQGHTKEETQVDKYKNICRFLAFVLRHKPQVAHLKLDELGFAEITKVIIAIEKRFKIKVTEQELTDIAKKYAMKFFLFENGKIKARFGHTIILNMLTPENFESTMKVPHGLYGVINKDEMWNVSKNGLQSSFILSGLFDSKSKLQINGNLVVHINTEKAIKNNVAFFCDKNNRYFCKFVPATYLKFEL
jgi:RNA:NAD 2'-phosphotransferase (TPT1/KptA family)